MDSSSKDSCVHMKFSLDVISNLTMTYQLPLPKEKLSYNITYFFYYLCYEAAKPGVKGLGTCCHDDNIVKGLSTCCHDDNIVKGLTHLLSWWYKLLTCYHGTNSRNLNVLPQSFYVKLSLMYTIYYSG